MITIGLDIGTTKICGVLKKDAAVLLTVSRANDAGLPKEKNFEDCQDPARILFLVDEILAELFRAAEKDRRNADAGFTMSMSDTPKQSELYAIGLSAQMHGILYVDAEGEAVSPFYTWRDTRGNERWISEDAEKGREREDSKEREDSRKREDSKANEDSKKNKSYSEKLSELTGYSLAPRFGAVLHFYNLCNGLVPKNAVKICNIGDYVAMKLTGRKTPLIHPTMAASFGCFDLEKLDFDREALKAARLDEGFFPSVGREELVGKLERAEESAENMETRRFVPVTMALGDNQASYLGTVPKPGALLINIGTGSQLSVSGDEIRSFQHLECRPYLNGQFLYVGASLSGGRAYAELKDFFKETGGLRESRKRKNIGSQTLTSFSDEEIYEAMNHEALRALSSENSKSLQGTSGGMMPDRLVIGETMSDRMVIGETMSGQMVLGVIDGIIDELYRFYEEIGGSDRVLYGSGNGIRKNPAMQKAIEKRFGRKLILSEEKEEAATGAALYGEMITFK